MFTQNHPIKILIQFKKKKLLVRRCSFFYSEASNFFFKFISNFFQLNQYNKIYSRVKNTFYNCFSTIVRCRACSSLSVCKQFFILLEPKQNYYFFQSNLPAHYDFKIRDFPVKF